uniref:Uncharacterized protein n=1 Tax=Peromyscus maniculatus bairdii TaxID=230844 RepID=A0A8C8UES3_PERMB
MPEYCRAPNCPDTAGQLGADYRPGSVYKGRGISKFNTSLIYRVSSRTARAVPQRSLSQKKKKIKKGRRTQMWWYTLISVRRRYHNSLMPAWST